MKPLLTSRHSHNVYLVCTPDGFRTETRGVWKIRCASLMGPSFAHQPVAPQCKLAVFGLMLTIAATAAACPAGWTPSPNASWANQCFGVPAGRSSSLRSCVELCGAEGGVPACIASAEENGFAAELLGNETAWLGLYQNDTSGGVDEGWGRCVAFEAPSFSNWSGGEPSDQRS